MTDIVERLRNEHTEWKSNARHCIEVLEGRLAACLSLAVQEITRLRKIEAAAKNLLAVKGRYHTEQAYKMLEDAVKGEE